MPTSFSHNTSHKTGISDVDLSGPDFDPPAISVWFNLRFAALAALIVAEWLPVSVFIHTGSGGQSAARIVVAFVSIFLAFGYLRNKRAIRHTASQVKGFQVSWRFLNIHLAAMLAFLALSAPSLRNFNVLAATLITATWYAAGAAGVVSAAFVFIPPAVWRDLLRSTGNLWIYALGGGVLAWRLVTVSWAGWNNPSVKPVTDLTFRFVLFLLRPFLPDLVSDRATFLISSSKFGVIVGDACSGLEGAGLMLAFTMIWLWLFRRECRFPRAFLVIPGGIAVMFVLNGVRIAALILIGNAGAPAIAMGGFHSQAGWIAFNIVALACSVFLPRVSWLSSRESVPHAASTPNPTIPYLLPFVSVLAAGMVSRSVSAGFEWMYPLRFLAAAAALWTCRRSYRNLNWKALNWKPGWESVLAGVGVFVLWIALDRGPHHDNGIAAGLATMSPAAKNGWLFFRTLAAVVTVPVAEELAFRGFLLRRLVSADFEAVDLRQFKWFAILGSSLIFGLMHGDRWFAGSLAGLAYAAVMLRRGSIGSAVVAHAVTNGLLAVLVLTGGKWFYW